MRVMNVLTTALGMQTALGWGGFETNPKPTIQPDEIQPDEIPNQTTTPWDPSKITVVVPSVKEGEENQTDEIPNQTTTPWDPSKIKSDYG